MLSASIISQQLGFAKAVGIVFLFVLGPVLLLMAHWHQSKLKPFREGGREAEAEVISKKQRSQGRSYLYYLSLSYLRNTANAKQPITTTSAVSYQVWKRLHPEETITIVVMPHNPQKVIPLMALDKQYQSPIERYALGYWMMAIGGSLFLLSYLAQKLI